MSRAEAIGSGRACQRPRTSSDAKCFSCEGALAKDPQIFKFLAYTATFFQNPYCAARGHALAIWHRYAAPRSTALAPLGLRSAAKCAPRRATLIIFQLLIIVSIVSIISFYHTSFAVVPMSPMLPMLE